MSRFSNYFKRAWPGWVSHALLRFGDVFPSRSRHTRERRAASKLGLDTVAAGPFRGMSYGPDTGDGALLVRLLGTYEKEVYPAVEKIIAANPDRVVVAGAGEGYYAIGLARRLPEARLTAFEISRWSRYLLARYAETNKVRIDLREWCSAETLREALNGSHNPAVVCDIEGGERDVLDPVAVPDLRWAIILAELHPMYIDGIEEMVVSRFEETHQAERMVLGTRTPADVPSEFRSKISDEEIMSAIDEVPLRGTGTWLLLTPKGDLRP